MRMSETVIRIYRREYYQRRKAMGIKVPSGNPTAVCAGGCGRELVGGGSSLPDGERMCRECRKRESILARKRTCEFCGEHYLVRRRNVISQFCSPKCYGDSRRIHASDAERYADKHRRRRALKNNLPVEPYTTAEIAHRDGYRCGICGLPVNMALSGMHQWGPNIDHIIPIIAGGPDVLANVQLAHRKCNLVKGARYEM